MIKNKSYDKEYSINFIKIKKRNKDDEIKSTCEFHRKTYIGSCDKKNEKTFAKVKYVRKGNKIIIDHLEEGEPEYDKDKKIKSWKTIKKEYQ